MNRETLKNLILENSRRNSPTVETASYILDFRTWTPSTDLRAGVFIMIIYLSHDKKELGLDIFEPLTELNNTIIAQNLGFI